MSAPLAQPKRLPPAPPPSRPTAPQPQPSAKKNWQVKQGRNLSAQKVVIYGPGGIGKTELCRNAEAAGMKPFFIDLEQGTGALDVARIDDVTSFAELRDLLHEEAMFAGYDAIVIDSLTKAQELIEAHVVGTIPVDDTGKRATSIESYGWGKGMTFVYEGFQLLLSDLDALHRAGKTIIGIAHDCTASVPNPGGHDWIRYEPRLQSPASGKASVRLRVREWADHLFFIGYDIAVNKEGKGQGGGTRCIYPTEMPTHMAKSRMLSVPIPYDKDSAELWNQLKG